MRVTINETKTALRRWGLAATLLWATAAGAGVVGAGGYTVGGDRSGYVGEQVSLSFSETGLSGFAGAELSFSFDASRLSFVGVADDCFAVPAADICGSAIEGPNDGVTGVVSLFLMVSSGLDISGDAGLFTLLFTINSGAPVGDALVSFTNVADLSDPSTTTGIYDRASLDGTITVLDRNGTGTLPLPGSAPLVFTALGVLAWTQRRRATRVARQTPR